MKENSRKDIQKVDKLIKKCDECKLNECINCEISWTEVVSIKKITDEYKKVLKMNEVLLKENEEIRIKNNAIKRESEAYAEHMSRLDNELNLEKEKSKYEWIRQNCLPQELVNKLYIPVQKVKDKIEYLDNQQKQWLEDRKLKKSDREIIFARDILKELLEKE